MGWYNLVSKIQLKDFTAQPCKSRLAFEFIPKHKHELKLEDTATALRQTEVSIEVETPFLLMMTVKGHGVSLFKSAKIIVKDTNDKEVARKIAETILESL